MKILVIYPSNIMKSNNYCYYYHHLKQFLQEVNILFHFQTTRLLLRVTVLWLMGNGYHQMMSSTKCMRTELWWVKMAAKKPRSTWSHLRDRSLMPCLSASNPHPHGRILLLNLKKCVANAAALIAP